MPFYPQARKILDTHSQDMKEEGAQTFELDTSGVKSEFHKKVTLGLASLISKYCILPLVLKNGVKSMIILVKSPEQHLDIEAAH